jgi:hypothetical protein
MAAIHEFPEPEEPDEQPTQIIAAAGDSVLDAIRKRYDDLAVERHYDLEVPGWHGCFVLRCGPINSKKLGQVRERLSRGGGGTAMFDFAFNADVIIDSCREVLVRLKREDELESVDPGGEAVGIDARLADLLHIKTNRARDLLLAIYKGAPSPEVAIERAQIDLYQWSSGAEQELEEDVLGES